MQHVSESLEVSRSAGNRLRKLNSHTDGTMNRIIIVNGLTMRRLQELERIDAQWQYRKVILDKGLALLTGPELSPETAVREQYATHVQKIKEEVEAITLEAQRTLLDLEAVEENLNSIQEIATHDLLEVKGNHRTHSRQIAAYFGVKSNEIYKMEKQTIALNA